MTHDAWILHPFKVVERHLIRFNGHRDEIDVRHYVLPCSGTAVELLMTPLRSQKLLAIARTPLLSASELEAEFQPTSLRQKLILPLSIDQFCSFSTTNTPHLNVALRRWQKGPVACRTPEVCNLQAEH